jgi:hypothetical protein
MSSSNRIGYLMKTIAYTDTTSVDVGFLPPNAFVTDVKVLVTTDFTDGVLDVGITGTAAHFADDVSLNGTGSATVTSTAQWGVVQDTSDQTTVTAIVVATGTGLAAGSAKLVVEFAYIDE